RQSPDAIALVWEGQQFNYGQINRLANRIAHDLVAMGVSNEEKVGLRVQQPFEQLIGTLGILKAGASYVLLDMDDSMWRLAYLIEACCLKRIISSAFDIPSSVEKSLNNLPAPEWIPLDTAIDDNLKDLSNPCKEGYAADFAC